LCKEFRDVVIEARKVFERFNMLGSRVDVVGTNKESFSTCVVLVEHDHSKDNTLIGLYITHIICNTCITIRNVD
jgi:hypothetical protein